MSQSQGGPNKSLVELVQQHLKRNIMLSLVHAILRLNFLHVSLVFLVITPVRCVRRLGVTGAITLGCLNEKDRCGGIIASDSHERRMYLLHRAHVLFFQFSKFKVTDHTDKSCVGHVSTFMTTSMLS